MKCPLNGRGFKNGGFRHGVLFISRICMDTGRASQLNGSPIIMILGSQGN